MVRDHADEVRSHQSCEDCATSVVGGTDFKGLDLNLRLRLGLLGLLRRALEFLHGLLVLGLITREQVMLVGWKGLSDCKSGVGVSVVFQINAGGVNPILLAVGVRQLDGDDRGLVPFAVDFPFAYGAFAVVVGVLGLESSGTEGLVFCALLAHACSPLGVGSVGATEGA